MKTSKPEMLKLQTELMDKTVARLYEILDVTQAMLDEIRQGIRDIDKTDELVSMLLRDTEKLGDALLFLALTEQAPSSTKGLNA